MPAKKGSRGRDPEILVYLHRFCEGGVERVALRLADSWSRSGARVTIAVAYATPPVSSVPAGNWVVRQSGMTWWPRSLEGLWMAAWLIRCVRRGSPDVIFCPGNSYTISAVLAKAWLGRKCPPILCKISNSLVRRDFTGVVRKAYDAWLRLQGRTIDCFAATAEPVAFEAERALAIDPARIAVLPNPVIDRALVERLDAAAQDHSPRNAWTFLSVGRLVPQKNYALLLHAFAHVLAVRPGEAMRLVILGEGPERARLEALRARLGLEGSVELPGHCDDVVSWLGQADCFVLSSDYEGLPGVVVEALAAGLPVVSTDSTVGLRALVEDGRDGWIVPVRDARALADAMGRVRELPADRQTMRARALRFSLENSAPLYLDKLRDLALSAA